MIPKENSVLENVLFSSNPFYIISFLAVCGCSIPFFLLNGKNSNNGVTGDDTSALMHKLFSVELNSRALLFASIAIMGSVTPMIIFLFCDLMLGTIRTAFIRFYRLATIFFPCLLIASYAIPFNSEVMLAFAVTIQTILHLCGFIVRIHTYGFKIWSFRVSVTILILWTIALCIQMNQFLFLENFYFQLGELLCSIVGFVVFLYCARNWVEHLAVQYQKNRVLSIEEFTCTKNVVILCLAFIIQFTAMVSYQVQIFSGFLVLLLLTQNFAALLVVVLHEYVLRSKITHMEVIATFIILLIHL